MSAVIIDFPKEAVFQREHRFALTTSLWVAKVFGKRHGDVLRTISSLKTSEEFNRRNFASRDYIDDRGKAQPMYEITRDGMVMLVMGFTGERAMAFKERYIEAFNSMEQALDYGSYHREVLKNNWYMKKAVMSDNPRLSRVHRYLIMGLNCTEIAKILSTSACTIRRDAKLLSKCGLLSFARQRVQGQTPGKHYPKINEAESSPQDSLFRDNSLQELGA
jgi:Rha family phage regulatory protein